MKRMIKESNINEQKEDMVYSSNLTSDEFELHGPFQSVDEMAKAMWKEIEEEEINA